MHDEEDNVAAFHARTRRRARRASSSSSCSSTTARATRTGERAAALAAADERVKVIALSRNFGHQAALTAGLEHARGDVVVMIDADLQDPPELIPEMVDALAARRRRRLRRARVARGRDALQARRPRAGSTACSRGWRGSSCAHDSGDFRLMDRRAARRAAGDARAQPLPARDDRLGRLHPDRRALPARRRARGGETKFTLAPDAALRLRRDHELLALPAAGRDAARLRLLGPRVPGDPARRSSRATRTSTCRGVPDARS